MARPPKAASTRRKSAGGGAVDAAAHPHVAKAEAYVDSVLVGVRPSCRWERLACERYRRDREREKLSVWLYRFDPELAERSCRFIELLPHTKGKWAAQRDLLVLEGWQCFVQINVFGFVRKDNDKRRFREAEVIVPRKNGKSAWSAGIGLYMLAADREHGAEVYSGATTEKQAWEVFRPAKMMAQGRPDLSAKLGIEVNASNINVAKNGSRFEPVIGKPGDGASPSCAIVDEFHEHDKPDLFDTMLTGMGAREQPLMWVITTAGDNLAGPCYDKLLTGRKILERTIEDEEKFFIEFTIDPEDDWTSEIALVKANPNLGVSVDLDFLRSRQREAVQNAREQGRFKTKHLNLWVQSRAAAFNLQKWNAGYDPTLALDQFAGRRAWAGLDLASEVDIAALEIVVEDDDGGLVEFGKYYLPEDTVSDPKNGHYRAWQGAGEIVVTDGARIDFERIESDLLDLAELFPRLEVGFDPYQATYLATRLEERGISCVKFPQQVATMSPAMKRLDALVLSAQIRHRHSASSPMTWMVSNVVAKVDAKDNIYPRKERPENKIDGPVALIMAVGRAMVGADVGPSVYEERGILTF